MRRFHRRRPGAGPPAVSGRGPREGTTVLLTTQYLEEADQLAGRIAVIDHGKIIADGTPRELKASVGSGVLHVRLAEPGDRERARQVLEQALGVTIYREPGAVTLTARVNGRAGGQDVSSAVARGMSHLSRDGITVTAFALGQPSLDEVFLALTGRTTHNAASEANAT